MAAQSVTSAAPGRPGATAAPAAAAVQEELNPYRWLILIGVLTASIMEILDTTIINVALPQMAGNLGATTTEIGWVSTSYILANVVVLPMTAFLAARFGRKRYLTFSILVFLIASFFCGTSHTLGELVFWRIVQGAGGAALLSTAQATLRQIFPREQQGTVMGLFTLGLIMAPTLGPTLGGWITDNYTWSWVFFVNLPIGALSLFLVTSFLEDPPGQQAAAGQSVDWLGIGLLAVSLGALQYVLEEGNKDDWFESETITLLSIVAGVSLAVLIWWQLSPRNKAPVVNLHVMKNRELSSALALYVLLGFGLYGGVFLFPLFVQGVLGFTPTETGLVLLPGGIATGISAILCGRMLNGDRPLVDYRLAIVFGLVIFCISMWDLGHLTAQSGIDDTRIALIVRGFGLGFLFTPLNLAAFSSLKPWEIPQAAGLINLARQLGGSFGIALLSTYITNKAHFHQAILSEHLNAGNLMLAERLNAVQMNLMAHGYSPALAKAAAMGQIAQSVGLQARTMSFNDGFLLILLSCIAASPAIFILRRLMPRGGPAPAADSH
jgi:MFS transporter, DHA2 family, multidrug resistance protein